MGRRAWVGPSVAVMVLVAGCSSSAQNADTATNPAGPSTVMPVTTTSSVPPPTTVLTESVTVSVTSANGPGTATITVSQAGKVQFSSGGPIKLPWSEPSAGQYDPLHPITVTVVGENHTQPACQLNVGEIQNESATAPAAGGRVVCQTRAGGMAASP